MFKPHAMVAICASQQRFAIAAEESAF